MFKFTSEILYLPLGMCVYLYTCTHEQMCEFFSQWATASIEGATKSRTTEAEVNHGLTENVGGCNYRNKN